MHDSKEQGEDIYINNIMEPPKPAISSKILGLKFMQRHRAAGLPAAAASGASPAATARSPATATEPATATGTAAAEKEQWTLPTPHPSSGSHAVTAAGDVEVLLEEAPLDGPQALLSFCSGRRSFGGSNPRLERRLADIDAQKQALRTRLDEERRAEEERRRKLEEHAALLAKAEASEAIERRNGVSEEEMARHFAKYVPAARPRPPPPQRTNHQPTGSPPTVPHSQPPPPMQPPSMQQREQPATAGGKKRKQGSREGHGQKLQRPH